MYRLTDLSTAAASSAALFGAAVVLVGCDRQTDDDLNNVDGQFAVTETPLDETDPNELPPGVGAEDGELGTSRLNDGTPEEPGVTEYDSTPVAPGETDS